MYNSLQFGTVLSWGITYFIAFIVVSLRYFQTIHLIKKFELDLGILTISMGTSLYYFVTLKQLMDHGWGRHISELTTEDLILFNQDLLANTLTYLVTPSITKMAMLVVLFRISPSWKYRGGVIACGVAIFVYTLVLTIITGGPCNPHKAGTTLCLEHVALSQAILNIASDFAVLFLPIPTIHNLNMAKKQKVTIGCIMAIGSFVVVCSIARLPYVLILRGATDVTYLEAILGVWSVVEVNLGIICGASMRLRQLLVRYLPRLGLHLSSDNSRKPTPSKPSSYTPWNANLSAGNKAQHSYQLHSIQQSSREPGSTSASQNDNIHICRQVDVRVEDKDRDDSSTEILV